MCREMQEERRTLKQERRLWEREKTTKKVIKLKDNQSEEGRWIQQKAKR